MPMVRDLLAASENLVRDFGRDISNGKSAEMAVGAALLSIDVAVWDLFGWMGLVVQRSGSQSSLHSAALLYWLTILVGKPFTLQYAREDLPRKQWNDPALVQSCRFMAIVWGLLMVFSTSVSCFKVMRPGVYPEIVYSSISIGTIMGGTLFTQFYKKYKRSSRADSA